jgi:hypothetical protein
MDLLGFSTEDLDKLNNTRPTSSSKPSAPQLPPIPDLSGFSEPCKSRYFSLREAEQLRLTLRHSNLNPSQSSSDKNQSANLAKIQKATKKLKTLSEDCKDEVLKELKELTLSRFISEVAHSLSENRFNSKDFLSLIEISSYLHQRYPDFQKAFILELKKQHKEGDIARKRNVLRFITEMICYGLWNDHSGFLKVIQSYCVNNDYSNNLLLISFVFRTRSEELFAFAPTADLNLRQAGEQVAFAKLRVLNEAESNLLVKTLKDFLKNGLKFIEELHQVRFN